MTVLIKFSSLEDCGMTYFMHKKKNSFPEITSTSLIFVTAYQQEAITFLE